MLMAPEMTRLGCLLIPVVFFNAGCSSTDPGGAQSTTLGGADSTTSATATTGETQTSGATSTSSSSGTTGGMGGAATGSSVVMTATTGATGTTATTTTGGTASGAGGTTTTTGSGGGATTGGMADDPTCQMGIHDASDPPQAMRSTNDGAHDPSVIQVDDTFYRFQTGGGHINAKTSASLTSGWQNRGVALSGSFNWIAEEIGSVSGDFWAPDVIYMGDQYHLYYSASAFGSNRSCIGHATLPTIAPTGWVDQGMVICTYGTENYNAIDPDVVIDQEGTPWMNFGSFWDGVMLIQLDTSGNRVGSDIENLAQGPNRDGEGSFIVYRCGYYYLFLSHGLCCPGADGRSVNDLTYNVVVGRSESIHGPYVDASGTELLDGGGTIVIEGTGQAPSYAAGHAEWVLADGVPYIVYHAYPGPSFQNEFRAAKLVWDDEGWPVPVPQP